MAFVVRIEEKPLVVVVAVVHYCYLLLSSTTVAPVAMLLLLFDNESLLEVTIQGTMSARSDYTRHDVVLFRNKSIECIPQRRATAWCKPTLLQHSEN